MLVVCAVAAVAATRPTNNGNKYGYCANNNNCITLNNGVQMPQMALGTWWENGTAEANMTAQDAILKAYKAGFRNFMTAWSYHNMGCGKGGCPGDAAALQTLWSQGVKREDIFLTSMTPQCLDRKPTAASCYNYTRDRLQDDLALLGVDYLDMVIIHFPDTGPMRGCDEVACETDAGDWQAYEDALKAGKVRSIGVSNYCQKCLDCIIDRGYYKPQLNQFQLHVGMGADPTGLVNHTTSRGVLVQSYSPLASGKILSTDLYGENYEHLVAIGAQHDGKSAAQVALKWIVQKGLAVTTKADNAKYLEEDIDMYGWDLTKEEMDALDAFPCNKTGWPMGYCDPSFVCPAHTFFPAPSPAQ